MGLKRQVQSGGHCILFLWPCQPILSCCTPSVKIFLQFDCAGDVTTKQALSECPHQTDWPTEWVQSVGTCSWILHYDNFTHPKRTFISNIYCNDVWKNNLQCQPLSCCGNLCSQCLPRRDTAAAFLSRRKTELIFNASERQREGYTSWLLATYTVSIYRVYSCSTKSKCINLSPKLNMQWILLKEI